MNEIIAPIRMQGELVVGYEAEALGVVRHSLESQHLRVVNLATPQPRPQRLTSPLIAAPVSSRP